MICPTLQLRRFGKIIKIATIEMDGDRFLLSVPPLYFWRFFSNELQKEEFSHKNFLNQLPSSFVLCNDDADFGTNIYACDILCSKNPESLSINKELCGNICFLPILIPLDKDSCFDNRALDNITNGTMVHGGMYFVDGNPVSVTGDFSYNKLPDSFSSITVASSNSDNQLTWMKMDSLLVCTSALMPNGSFSDLLQAFV